MICFKCNLEIETKCLYGLHEECFHAWFGLPNINDFHDLDPKKTSSTINNSEINKKRDTFFHGAYLKYSAKLGDTSYILKIQEAAYPDLPIVEYICNQIAHLLGIDVPSHYLISYNDHITFVTRNFMQDYTGTLLHIYRLLPDGEENYNCEEIIKAILNKTGKLADIAKFIEICLFDSLIGNNDRHGRNLGIIETSTIKKLSPMYDNPSFIGIQDDFLLDADTNPSGSIWTKNSSEPKSNDYFVEFKRLGYEDITNQFRIKVISQHSKIINLIQNFNLGQKRKNALIRLIEKRIGSFRNA